MRDFNDDDRRKKSGRITLPENPGNLPEEALSQLEGAVKGAAPEGHVACPSAWRLAKDAGVSRLDVGVMIDRLALRVTDCQLGCFKESKTPFGGTVAVPCGAEAARRVEALREQDELTCVNVFALARDLGEKPRSVADAANERGYKIRQCQLGCF